MFNFEIKQQKKNNRQISEEVDTTQKIAELQESVSSLLDNMPGMSFTKDAKTGVYLDCNKAFAKYAHKDPREVVGLTDYEIFDHETAEMYRTLPGIKNNSRQRR